MKSWVFLLTVYMFFFGRAAEGPKYFERQVLAVKCYWRVPLCSSPWMLGKNSLRECQYTNSVRDLRQEEKLTYWIS